LDRNFAGAEPLSISDTTPEDPLALFDRWYGEAKESEPNDPNGMALATVGPDGMPSLRMVLLKDFDAAGFVFFTNYESRKGQQLLANPSAALLFHWKSLRRQVRLEGPVARVSDSEADAYFATRPRQARIGAWASDQSRPLAGRFDLEKRVARFAAKYAVGSIPRPPHWSGFRLDPVMIEFWQDGAFRLHDRLVYHREATAWRTERLFP
jgi:pyridoxamine 5'-phosphate oxidase